MQASMKKVKLDENFPPSFLSLFQNEIIDASSVHLQGISGTNDGKSFKNILCTDYWPGLSNVDIESDLPKGLR